MSKPSGVRVVAPMLFLLLVPAALLACGEERELREWRASDHSQPSGDAIDPSRVPDEPSGSTEERAAAALWTVSCASCHGRGGRGDGPARPPNANVRDLTDPEWQDEKTDEEIADVIANGRNMMPRFGDRVRPRGIAALVRHVRMLGGRAPAGDPGAQPTQPPPEGGEQPPEGTEAPEPGGEQPAEQPPAATNESPPAPTPTGG